MKPLYAVLFVLISFNSVAQGTEYRKVLFNYWETHYGEAIVDSDKYGLYVGSNSQGYPALTSLNSTGNVNWSQSLEIGFKFNDIITTSDSALLVIGPGYNSTQTFIATPHVFKMTLDGDTIWSRSFDASSGNSCFRVRGIETYDSSYVIAWSDDNSYDYGVAKIDTDGNQIWSYIIQGNNGHSTVNSIRELQDSSLIIAGYTGNPEQTGFLQKLNSQGLIEWTKYLENTYLEDIVVKDSTFYAVARIELAQAINKVALSRFTMDGINLWQHKFESVWPETWLDRLNQIEIVNDSTFFIANQSDWSNMGILVSQQGTVQNAFNYEMSGQSITSSSDGSVILMGNGPLLGVKTDLYSPNFGIIKTDTLVSTPYCAYDMNVSTTPSFVIADSSFTLTTVTGITEEQPVFNLNAITLIDSTMCVEFFGSADELNGLEASVYPNVSSGEFNIEVSTTGVIDVTIIDSKGQMILATKNDLPYMTIDLSEEADGFYFYKVIDENGRFTSGKLLLKK